jgi:hypothetical protein
MEVDSSRTSAYRGYLLFSKSISDNDVEIGVKWSGRPNLATLAPANKKLSNSGSQLSLTSLETNGRNGKFKSVRWFQLIDRLELVLWMNNSANE